MLTSGLPGGVRRPTPGESALDGALSSFPPSAQLRRYFLAANQISTWIFSSNGTPMPSAYFQSGGCV